jgi:hypothetical protein
MPPELQILAINATCLAVAYLGIFPALRPLTLQRLALADLAVGLTALGTAAALFWGSGQAFRLLILDTGWFWFALVTFVVMELPLFLWFMRRHGLNPDDDDRS